MIRPSIDVRVILIRRVVPIAALEILARDRLAVHRLRVHQRDLAGRRVHRHCRSHRVLEIPVRRGRAPMRHIAEQRRRPAGPDLLFVGVLVPHIAARRTVDRILNAPDAVAHRNEHLAQRRPGLYPGQTGHRVRRHQLIRCLVLIRHQPLPDARRLLAIEFAPRLRLGERCLRCNQRVEIPIRQRDTPQQHRCCLVHRRERRDRELSARRRHRVRPVGLHLDRDLSILARRHILHELRSARQRIFRRAEIRLQRRELSRRFLCRQPHTHRMPRRNGEFRLCRAILAVARARKDQLPAACLLRHVLARPVRAGRKRIVRGEIRNGKLRLQPQLAQLIPRLRRLIGRRRVHGIGHVDAVDLFGQRLCQLRLRHRPIHDRTGLRGLRRRQNLRQRRRQICRRHALRAHGQMAGKLIRLQLLHQRIDRRLCLVVQQLQVRAHLALVRLIRRKILRLRPVL